MINIRTLRKLSNGDGLTLKHGKIVEYKTGYQVADIGYETTDINEAIRLVRITFRGDCGIWYENGIWYIDHSFRVGTKKRALEIGKQYNQISIFRWAKRDLIYC